ncbi:MAG: DoxX family membrane protein [Chloroflexales bacterium]|nr:DoxX family membrane protein [Chloroflexales bacterium]
MRFPNPRMFLRLGRNNTDQPPRLARQATGTANPDNLLRQVLSQQPEAASFRWSWNYAKRYRLKTAGIVSFLACRYLFGAFFVYGAYHKLSRRWIGSDVLRQHFQARLADIDPDSFQAAYLRRFAIPCYAPIAWFLVAGQLSVGASTMFGAAVRPNAALALFMLLNITAGSFSNPSMPPFIVYATLLMLFPSGHWLGLDSVLHKKYPRAIWFR